LGASSSRSRRQTFITRYSKLWRLYDICGFDLDLDLVYNSMHILPLNLFKGFLEQSISEGRAADVDRALNEISTHRPKQLGARWPSDCSNRLSYWRAEEYQQFVLSCLPYYMEKTKKETDDIRSLHPQLTVLEKKSIQKVYMLFKIGQILTRDCLVISFLYTFIWLERRFNTKSKKITISMAYQMGRTCGSKCFNSTTCCR
jgi:hypothetical protein